MMDEQIPYLDRQHLDDVQFEVGLQRVRISTVHTTYVNVASVHRYNLNAILDLYNIVTGDAKSKKVRISYKSHLKRTVLEQWQDYEDACRHCDEQFDEIVKHAKVVKNRGLHLGVVDDMELAKLQAMCAEYSKIHHASHIISKFADIWHQLNDSQRFLANSDGESIMITL